MMKSFSIIDLAFPNKISVMLSDVVVFCFILNIVFFSIFILWNWGALPMIRAVFFFCIIWVMNKCCCNNFVAYKEAAFAFIRKYS